MTNEKQEKKVNDTKRKKINKKVLIILSAVLLFAVCVTIAIIIFINDVHSEIYESPEPTPSKAIVTKTLPPDNDNNEDISPVDTKEPSVPDIFVPEDDIEFILLFGLADFDLADSIWIGIINKTQNKVDFLTIPRDTYLQYYDRENPDHWKINSYYNNYINDNWVKTTDAESSMYLLGACEVLLGVDMDHYVRISYDTIIQVIDAMGGIEYDVPFDMIYSDCTEGYELEIEIFKGNQILSGEDVVKFLRFRQGIGYDEISDIARINRQHKMIKAILRNALSFSNISPIIEVMKSNIRTNLSKDHLSSLITFSLKLNSEKIGFHTLKGYETMVDTKVKDSEGDNIIRSFYITDETEIRSQIESICK